MFNLVLNNLTLILTPKCKLGIEAIVISNITDIQIVKVDQYSIIVLDYGVTFLTGVAV